jgi:hypothetical protein
LVKDESLAGRFCLSKGLSRQIHHHVLQESRFRVGVRSGVNLASLWLPISTSVLIARRTGSLPMLALRARWIGHSICNEQLLPNDRRLVGCLDPKSDPVAANREHPNVNGLADPELFVRLAV